MDIREATRQDLYPLLELYTHLHGNPMPREEQKLQRLWEDILGDKNYHILLGIEEKRLVSSCVLLIVPNLTHAQRPYALVENVVTHRDFRGRGYASQLLTYAGQLAKVQHCYKIMLMTGSKEESVLGFYRRAGYNSYDKTAFVQWLGP